MQKKRQKASFASQSRFQAFPSIAAFSPTLCLLVCVCVCVYLIDLWLHAEVRLPHLYVCTVFCLGSAPLLCAALNCEIYTLFCVVVSTCLACTLCAMHNLQCTLYAMKCVASASGCTVAWSIQIYSKKKTRTKPSPPHVLRGRCTAATCFSNKGGRGEGKGVFARYVCADVRL